MALLGVLGTAGLGTAGWALWQIRPRDPMFEVVNISISGFNLNWQRDGIVPYAVVDVSLTLYIKVVNPNVTPIQYTSTIMNIFYRGTQLGQATVKAGSQEARSEHVIEVPAKLDGLQVTNHVKELFADVAKREMVMNAVVTINGDAVVWKIKHSFEVTVKSDIKVDPVLLEVLDQDNRVEMDLGIAPQMKNST